MRITSGGPGLASVETVLEGGHPLHPQVGRMSGFLLTSGASLGPTKDRSSSEEGEAAVSTSETRKPVPNEIPTATPHKSWLLLYKEKKEICIQAGKNLKKICKCCMRNKISPQECTSQEVLEVSESKSSSFSPPSFAGSCSNATETKDGEISLADMSYDTILERIRHGEKRFQEKILNITFLSSVSALCRDAEENGLEEPRLPCSKAHLAEHVMMLMANLPEGSVPNTTLVCAMYAIQNLSKIKPPLPPDVESGILRFSLQGVLILEAEGGNIHSQALYKTSSDTLQEMLRGLLEEEPTTGHLLFILEHINFWIKSRDPKERARAQRVSTALLQHVLHSPHFDDFDDLPLVGRHVAELALYLTDSNQVVSEQASDGIMCLYNLLLHRNEVMVEAPWCQQWQNNKEMQGYIYASKVGQIFAEIFTEQQKRYFLQTSLLAISDPLVNIREAAVLLTYSLLGREKVLLGKEVKEVKANIMKEIHKLKTCMKVTDLLQGFLPSQDELVLKDPEKTEEEF